MMLMSYAYPWSSYIMQVPAGWSDCGMGLYPLLSMERHLSSGSMNIVNRNGDRVSPCNVPLWIGIVGMLPCDVM